MFFTPLFYFPHLQESTKHFAKNAQDKQRREREGEREREKWKKNIAEDESQRSVLG
jgi:hypothetical protein